MDVGDTMSVRYLNLSVALGVSSLTAVTLYKVYQKLFKSEATYLTHNKKVKITKQHAVRSIDQYVQGPMNLYRSVIRLTNDICNA